MKFGKQPVNPGGKIASFFFLVAAVSVLSAQQEIRICALRVDFQPDQNQLTTGDGLFLSDSLQVTPYTIDPPPHDRSYFLDQIMAVDNYFQAASKGHLQVSGDVFPHAQNGAYRLPYEMGYYNPNTTDEENNRQLARLFADALALADQDDQIIFSDYDLVTIFHAGVGRDIDFGFDSTPQDLPSLYLNTAFFNAALDTSFDGFSVDAGGAKITCGIILPETESQEGIEVALTGIFASNIGSYLGLYDLFSPSSKKSGIGRFGLMDAGLFNLYGLAPAIPCAYSRKLLNWDDAQLLSEPRDTVLVNRFEGTASLGTTIYQLPINNDEYYLIEYRGDSSIKIDSLYALLAENRPELPTYLEVLKTYYAAGIEVSDSTGVLLKLKDYDLGLPGAGILIWHIDESVIAARGALNAINDDRNNRGVDVEEADGSQDIGYEYTVLESGYQSEQGTWLDFWFNGNPAPLYRNEFSSGSSPNTLTNRVFAKSHISLNNFSTAGGSSMSFSYRREYFESGFPLDLNDQAEQGNFGEAPLAAQCAGYADPLIFSANDSGWIMACTAGGRGLLAPPDHRVARMLQTELPLISLADQDGDLQADLLIACTRTGLVQGFALRDQNNDLLLDTLFSVMTGLGITTPPVVQNPYFYLGVQNNQIYRFDFSGSLDSVYSFARPVNGFTVLSTGELIISSPGTSTYLPPVVVDLNSDGRMDRFYFDNPSRLVIEVQGSTATSVQLPEAATAAPSCGDLDGDGFYEIFFNLADRIYGLHFDGAAVSNFPLRPPLPGWEQLQGTPLLFDADGDQYTDIVVCTSHGQVLAFNQQGQMLAGFPFSAGDTPAGSALAADYDGDGNLELFVLDTSGKLSAWQLESGATANKLWWSQSVYNYTHNNYITNILTPPPPSGADLLPAASVYNYPNPNTADFTVIRYYLREDARVQIRIFDLAGDRVDSFNGPGLGQQHNEVRWDLSSISSGVYLCRVEARSEQAGQVRLIKILVIK